MKPFNWFRDKPSQDLNKENELMFEMEQIGKRISSHRKQRNMTQQDLADQMGVTYQAVSNWERGISIPDVLRLKDLSALFDISLDELMGNDKDARIVKVASGTETPHSIAELVESAPYMKPKDLEERLLDQIGNPPAEPCQRQSAPMAPQPPVIEPPQAVEPPQAIEPIQKIEPIMSIKPIQSIEPVQAVEAVAASDRLPETLHSAIETKAADPEAILPLVSKAQFENDSDQEEPTHEEQNQDQSFRFEDIAAMAPFLSSDALERVLRQIISQDQTFEPQLLSTIAPFLDGEHLGGLIRLAVEKELPVTGDLLLSTSPFIESDALELLAIELVRTGKISPDHLIALAPFLDGDGLHRIIKQSDQAGQSLPEDVILGLAPFLDSETIHLLLKSRPAASSFLIQGLLPFADEDVLEDLLLRTFNRR